MVTHIEKMSARDDEVIALSDFAFQYKLDKEARLAEEKKFERHQILGCKINEQMAGKLHIIPLQVFVNGKPFKMGGIGDVATWPEHRRKGVAKSLLVHALQEMKDSGQVVSLLHPFHVDFYRKYGWELTFYNKKYTLPIQQLKRQWPSEGYVRRTKDITLLEYVYEEYAKKYNGMLKRERYWWEQYVLTDEAAQISVAFDPSGQAEAYLIYKVRNDILTVIDLAYTTKNGLHLIYEFMSNHDSMAKEVQLTVPEDDLLPLHLSDPMFDQKLSPYFMARIVDVFAFLQQYPFKGANETVFLEVKDEWIAENNGCYELKTVQGNTMVTRVEEGKKPDFHCSVQQLASLLFSFRSASELFEHNFITGDEAAVPLLERMIPERQTFFADFF